MPNFKRLILALFGVFSIVAVAYALNVKISGYLANENVSVNKTYVVPLNSLQANTLSYTSTVSSVTFAAKTFTSGQLSTGTIVVTSTTGLTAAQATDFLSILSTQAVGSDATITVNGVPLLVNVNWWFDLLKTSTTANSIKNAINTFVPNVSAQAWISSVTLTSRQYGSGGNAMTLASNCSTITVNAASFSGGKDSATLTINGVNIAFTPVASASATARSIANAINSNSALSTIVIATNPGTATTVWTTSTFVGGNTNYAVTSSTDSSLTVGGSTKTITNGASVGQMWGGTDASWAINGTVINIATHSFNVGLPVLYTTGTVAIGGLTNGTTYYVIPITANSIALASTSSNSVTGQAITLTSSQTVTTARTYTLTPLAISGTPAFQWEASNDGTNWYPYASTTSFSSFSATGTVTLQDFGTVNYGSLRLRVVAPTAGAINLKVSVNGRGD